MPGEQYDKNQFQSVNYKFTAMKEVGKKDWQKYCCITLLLIKLLNSTISIMTLCHQLLMFAYLPGFSEDIL